MSHRFSACLAIVVMSLASAAGQTQKAAVKKTAGVPARTPDGHPDLQGVWTGATITPFERPRELAGKPVLTEDEAAQLEQRAAENRVDKPPAPGDVGAYNQVWFDGGTKVVKTRQTSLAVAPPD